MLRQLGQRARGFASAAEAPLKATLFPGDGVGPEIADAVTLVLKTAGVPIQWEVQVVKHDKPDPRTNSFVSRENLDSVKVRSRGHFWRQLCPSPCFDAPSTPLAALSSATALG